MKNFQNINKIKDEEDVSVMTKIKDKKSDNFEIQDYIFKKLYEFTEDEIDSFRCDCCGLLKHQSCYYNEIIDDCVSISLSHSPNNILEIGLFYCFVDSNDSINSDLELKYCINNFSIDEKEYELLSILQRMTTSMFKLIQLEKRHQSVDEVRDIKKIN